MINNISLDYLKIFYYVAKFENISKASEFLFISQPAITQTIQKLEQKLELTLFIRNKKGVELTTAGKAIYEHLCTAKSSLLQIDKYLEEINVVEQGELVIGCSSNLSRKILLNPIKEFLKKYPKITIKQDDKPQDIMLKKLSTGEVDLCISQKNNEYLKDYNFLPLLTEKFVFVCTKEFYKNIKNLERYIIQGSGTYNHKIYEKFLTQNKKQNANYIEVAGYNLAIELCLNSVGIALVPEYLVESHIKQNKLIVLNNFNDQSIVYGCYTNKHSNSKKCNIFIEFLQKNAKF